TSPAHRRPSRIPARAPSAMTLIFSPNTATTNLYTLSLHDALPICTGATSVSAPLARSSSLIVHGVDALLTNVSVWVLDRICRDRSEEHTSELQSRGHLVCRLLLEKKKP